MTYDKTTRKIDTVVVGGGQAGLATGYFLAQQGRDFVILDAGTRIGDTWRKRWDTLRLFTPALHSGLPGMPFPAPRGYFATKDEVAEYLEQYARQFALPIRLGVRVDALALHDDGYVLSAGGECYIAERVVVATGAYHAPRIPDFAPLLDSRVVQIHSRDYRNPHQLPDGNVLVVGAGNSGAEIAMDLATSRKVYLSGRDTGHIPLHLVHNRFTLWLANRAVTTDTKLGRKMRVEHLQKGDPLIRLRSQDLTDAGIERVARVTGAVDGNPRLADGRLLDVAVVVWATGFKSDFKWIELPIFDDAGYPLHQRGVAGAAAPGLYFIGLPFQYSPTSAHIGGVGRDARYVTDHLAAHSGRFPRRAASAVANVPAERVV